METTQDPGYMVSEKQAAEHEGLREQYFRERYDAVNRGETVIVRREFEAETGEVHDVFTNKQYLGFIELEYGFGYEAYRALPEGAANRPSNGIYCNTFDEARELLLKQD